MVEYKTLNLDHIFNSLSDPTRRDMLKRIAKKELSVGELAESYDLSFAAVSKHLMVLEKAQLITKRREGKQQFVVLSPPAFKNAAYYLEQYKKTWDERLDRLEELLKKQK